MATPLFHELPIRTREIFDGDSARSEDQTVFCPSRKTATAVQDCKTCPFAKSVENDAVICVRGGAESTGTFKIGNDPRVDVAAAAARTALREVMPPNVTCVRADSSLEMASRLLLERELRCLPVVDVDGRLIGIVSKSDLLREGAEGDALQMRVELEPGFHLEQMSARTVSEIMTPCVHALPEDAPVAFAISLLAFESLHEAPIVTSDGRVVGVVTALDVLKWLASRMGYEVPHAELLQKTAGKAT